MLRIVEGTYSSTIIILQKAIDAIATKRRDIRERISEVFKLVRDICYMVVLDCQCHCMNYRAGCCAIVGSGGGGGAPTMDLQQ